jgi:hypothetical protein
MVQDVVASPLPDVVPAVAVNPPLQGGGVSGSVLEEI